MSKKLLSQDYNDNSILEFPIFNKKKKTSDNITLSNYIVEDNDFEISGKLNG